MNSLLFICCVLIMITMGECFHRSFFDGIQEIETVSISHTFVHRTRRRASLRNTAVMPDVIVTEIKGDNQHSYLKFHRNRKKTLSPLFTLEVGLGLVEKKITVHCTHFYEDINHFAHAILDSCNETGSVKMMAEVPLNNELYMILPKDSQKADESFQHGLFKVNTTRDYSHDYRVPTENTNEENSIPSVNHRFRRQTERNYVELQLVIDYSLYTFWYGLTTGTQLEREAAALDLIQKMYAFLGNGVHLRYKGLQTTYGIDIDVELTSVYVLKTSEESAITENVDFTFSSRGTVDAETLLNSFKSWIDEQSVSNPDNILNADHFMLLTGREIVLSGNADAAGYAFYGKVCTSESMSIAEDKFNFLSIVTAAHELGHSLGGVHDGETDDANCRDEDGYILSSINAVYTDSKATHPWKFSPCSAAAFTTKLAELQASGNNCLRRDDTDPLLLPTGIPPGQMFPPDKQCKLMFDDESVMWRQRHDGAFDRMCTAMACTQLGLTKITFVIPGDGTTCGDKKWCWNGKCVYSEEAPPANDTCLHGDQTGAFISGSTCAETLAGDNIWKCYQANIEQTCCGTCAAGNTGLEGCEYGDVSDCSSISSAQCYNENIAKSSCCKTCYDFAKLYTNLPAECKYGDKKAGCDNSVATCTQFMSDCCASCTGFTMPSTSSTSTTTSSQTSATSDTTKKTTPKQGQPTEKPVEQDGLPDWVLPVAAGAGGVLVLSILIGLCTYCMKQSSKKKYKSEEDRRHSGDRRRNTGENRRVSENERRRSEENRRTSDNNRRDERRRSEDTRREGRRVSEDLRPLRNYNRRYSTPNGAYRY